MNLSRSINVGIVGLGWPGERHAEALQASSLGIVYAACDLNPERLKAFADAFGPKRVFTNYDEMLRDSDLDAVIIGLPNALHYPFSQRALQAGKHVLCEKPPTMNADQMRALHEEARNRGLVYYFGRQMRFSPAMQAAKKVVAERRLGEIYFAETMWVRSRGTPAGLDGWFTDRSKSGGGAMIDLGVHAIDAAWYLMGTPQPRAVSAQTYQKFPQLVESKVFDVEDNAYGMIRFENSATLLFKVCWAANLTDDIPLDPKRGRSLLSTTVYGPKGSLKLTDVFTIDSSICPSPLALFEDKGGELLKTDLPVHDLRGGPLRAYEFAEQDQNFLRSVRGEESAVNSSSQAVQLMEMLDAIYLSSQAGKEVPVTQQLIQMSSYATAPSGTPAKATSIKISGKRFAIYGEDDYLHGVGDEFEPNTVTLLGLLCESDSRVLDIGANIGMTALALSRICPSGQIAAVEPVPRNFEYLRRNVSQSGARNIKIFNFALGSSEGTVLMQGHPSNFACSFVADHYTIPADDHFSERVPIKRLDDAFSELSLDRLDFMKIDVEGFELEVLAGAKDILSNYRPIVFLEMNHWCLNIYRQISIPEFRERLTQIFPCVYAIDGLDYLDFVDQKNVHHINYHHVLEFKYMNLIAGFDREEIHSRLSRLGERT